MSNFVGRLMGFVDQLRNPDPEPEELPPTSVRAPKVLSAEEVTKLASELRRDWVKLVNGLLTASAPLAKAASDEDSDEAAALRIAGRATRICIHGLAWSRKEAIGEGIGDKKTRKLLPKLELAECDPGKLPPELERVATAFLAGSQVAVVDGERVKLEDESGHAVDAERRDRATIAAFYECIRLVADLLDELAIAAQAIRAAKPVCAGIERTLADVGVKRLAPAAGEKPDLALVRVSGYEDGQAAGAIARVKRAGLEYRGEVLRKAEVTLGSRS